MVSKIITNEQPPENQAVAKGISVAAGNRKMLEYLQSGHNVVVKRFGIAKDSEVATTAISDSILAAQYIEEKRAPLLEKLWNGTITKEELSMLEPGYFNYQDSLAQRMLEQLDETISREKLSNVVMVYDVNDGSEFVRGYLSHGTPLDALNHHDKEVIDVIDQTFHSWLDSNGMISQNGGVIYLKDKVDDAGKFVNKVDPKKVSSLLNDPTKGIGVAMKKLDKGFALEVRQRAAKPTHEQKPSPTIKQPVSENATKSPMQKGRSSTPDVSEPGATSVPGG